MSKPLTDKEKFCYEHYEQGYSLQQIADLIPGGSTRSKVRDGIRKARKKMNVSQSTGLSDILDEIGIDASHVVGGWIKTDGASIRFDTKSDNSDLDDTGKENIRDIIREVFNGEIAPMEPVKEPTYTDSDLLSKYTIADLHMGMHSWVAETGENYNLKEAERLLKESMDHLLASTPNSETGIILNLGDWFHTNDSKNMTPMSGHILDVDGRFAKIASTAVSTVKYIVERALQKHKKVIYVGIPGNHDRDQAFWLTIVVKEAFRNDPRVEVYFPDETNNVKFIDYFAYQHGKVMLTAHHGDRVNPERLALAIADMFSEMWGKTYWRFLDTGHIHHMTEKEVGGILFRSYRTIAAKDSYSAKSAYTSRRSLVAHTYHKERGEILSNNVHIFQGNVAR